MKRITFPEVMQACNQIAEKICFHFKEQGEWIQFPWEQEVFEGYPYKK